MTDGTETIEYRVREVKRFTVTKYTSSTSPTSAGGMLETIGEFDNANQAYAIAYALCKRDHDALGYPIDDERVVYPKPNDAV